MNIGVSSYSFARLMRQGMTYMDAAKTAKEIGFDVFEVQGLKLPDGEDRLAYAKKLKQYCEAIGIQIGIFTIDADLLNAFDGDTTKEIQRIQGEVEIAAALGSPGMRHDASYGYKRKGPRPLGFEDALPVLARGCREITAYAAGCNIKTMVENHGFFCQDSDRVEQLVRSVGHENFGLLLDMGNFLCADEAPEKAIGKLAQYAFHVHAKDFHVKSGQLPNPGRGWFKSRAGNFLGGTVIGFGNVPVLQCLSILKNAGYTGTISLEFEGMEENLWAIECGFENLKRFVELA